MAEQAIELTAKSPCVGVLPVSIGTLRAVEDDLGPLTLIQPLQGGQAAAAKALHSALGLAWPEDQRMTIKGDAQALWFGLDQVLVTGGAVPAALAKHAAVTDQSDAWASVTLSGAGAEDALARLVPIDLRAAAFGEGATARTLIGHMTGSVTRVGPDAFRLMVFRSMALTLVHDLKEAMATIAAQ